MSKKVQEFLNQPFVLWFFSSIVLGLITWQYAEMQKTSAEAQTEARVLKRSHLEVNLLLQDIRFGAESDGNLTLGLLGITGTKIQYNAINPSAQIYAPSLQNVMLEIDSRSGSKGLDKYQQAIYRHITSITKIYNRMLPPTPYPNPNERIWGRLNSNEKQSLHELAALTQDIQRYYQAVANQ